MTPRKQTQIESGPFGLSISCHKPFTKSTGWSRPEVLKIKKKKKEDFTETWLNLSLSQRNQCHYSLITNTVSAIVFKQYHIYSGSLHKIKLLLIQTCDIPDNLHLLKRIFPFLHTLQKCQWFFNSFKTAEVITTMLQNPGWWWWIIQTIVGKGRVWHFNVEFKQLFSQKNPSVCKLQI